MNAHTYECIYVYSVVYVKWIYLCLYGSLNQCIDVMEIYRFIRYVICVFVHVYVMHVAFGLFSGQSAALGFFLPLLIRCLSE